MQRNLTISIVLASAACGSHPNDVGPGTVLGPGQCVAEEVTDPLTDLPECSVAPNRDATTPCECEDYGGAYPEGVYDPPTAAVLTATSAYPGAKIDEDEYPGTMIGCSAYTRYAMPDCTTLAEASGIIIKAPTGSSDVDFDDNDYTFNICPIRETMRPHPFDTSLPMELRGSGSFYNLSGRIHVEVQQCRFNDMLYTVKEPEWQSAQWLDPSPQRTDLVSVAGDWLWDSFHSDEGGGWTEIHEARVIAVARAVKPLVSYLFVSSFFADQSLQRDEVALDIKVPAPQVDPASNTFLDCYMPDNVAGDRPDPKNPGTTIPASQDPTVVNPCPGIPNVGAAVNSVLFPVEADSANGFCKFKARARADSTIHDFNCQGTCDDGANFISCGQMAASIAIRAEWRDPGDTWVCDNCECADPSALGALISAPVQGCAQAGLDPSNPADQALACSQVCGGTMCGAAPSCRIGSCRARSSSSVARLVGRSTCDPTTPVPPGRVAPAGDYRVTLDASKSWVRVVVDDDSIQRPALGALHFNINGDVVDFASSELDVSPFSIKGRSVTDGRAFTVQRMFGHLAANNELIIPAGIGVFGARALLDGAPKGINARNPKPLVGIVDVANDRFVLDIDGSNEEDEEEDAEETRLIAHLEGTIDNLPPTANAGASERTVECTSTTTTAVMLSGTASRDPDAGDRITHYQWFDANTGAGLGNTSTITANLVLGLAQITLHVYDHLLGSGSTLVRVKVVDTTPPELMLQPTEICVWPPDHKRIRLHLGDEVKATVRDVCDANPALKIVSVTSNEPDNGFGDGNTVGDVAFSNDTMCVRRERSAMGAGRTYTAEVEASDASGNRVRQTVRIRVPQNSEPGCGGRFTTIADDAPCN